MPGQTFSLAEKPSRPAILILSKIKQNKHARTVAMAVKGWCLVFTTMGFYLQLPSPPLSPSPSLSSTNIYDLRA
jgi:hypothetical protein